VNLTALECSYREIEIQPIVRKDLHIDWPRAETPTHWRSSEFPGGTEDSANVARRSLFTHFDGRRLPRLPGSGYPQRRALHDSQVDFHKEVTISHLIASEETRFGSCLGTANSICLNLPSRALFPRTDLSGAGAGETTTLYP
jgi:hypothetical protein